MNVILKNAPRYRKARKKKKSRILDELSAIIHFNRKYLALLLRSAGRTVFTHYGTRVIADPRVSFVSRRGRKKVYATDLAPRLAVIWEMAGCISSVHLFAFIRANHDIVFNHPDLKDLSRDVKNKLRRMSHATVDRLLGPIRDKVELDGRYQRNPHASWIKKTIPVQPHYEKPANAFGYLEIDLVHHCGGNSRGQFAYTLTATEITTGWTELRILPNKAHIWVEKALKNIIGSVPFRVTALHSDNGSEFINSYLAKFARDRGIPFTRSRAFHKNDAPYVESKNWTLVRTYVGYRRYDTERELALLKRFERLIGLKHNLFIPTMKLVEKRRKGGRVYKRYETETPRNRLLVSGELTKGQKQRLTRLRKSTDYFKLIRRIDDLMRKLDQAYQSKYSARRTA